MTTGEPTRHHTVQRALLRGFADEDQFVVARKRDGSEKRRSARAATVVVGFYAYLDEEGAPDLRVEKALAGRLESTWPRLRDALRTRGSVTGVDKTDLDRYVAFALARTRSVRFFMEQTNERFGFYIAREETARQYGINLRDMSPEAIENFDRFVRGLLSLGKKFQGDPARDQLRTFVYAAARAQVRLSHLEWCHVVTPEDRVAIISDAGVAVLRRKVGGGLLPFAAPVVLPLGPHSLGVAALPQDIAELAASPDLVSRSNQALADSAFEECFRHPDTQWPAGVTFEGSPPRFRVEIAESRGRRVLDEDAAVALRRQYADPKLDSFALDLLAELSQD
jgi:hypothetical protein